jgi:hypothetical protein
MITGIFKRFVNGREYFLGSDLLMLGFKLHPLATMHPSNIVIFADEPDERGMRESVDVLIPCELLKVNLYNENDFKVKKPAVFTYFILSRATNTIKIGIAKDVEKRKKVLQNACGNELEILHVIEGNIEKELHSKFSHLRQKGEWFTYTEEIKNQLEMYLR